MFGRRPSDINTIENDIKFAMANMLDYRNSNSHNMDSDEELAYSEAINNYAKALVHLSEIKEEY